MNNEQTRTASRSFPTVGILGLIFVTLKLCGVINWSWWWVTAPFWAGLAVVLLLLFGLLAFVTIPFVWIVLKACFDKRK